MLISSRRSSPSERTAFASGSCGHLPAVRVMFAAYLLMLAAGLSVYIAVGLLHR
jgi:hypothetical protein